MYKKLMRMKAEDKAYISQPSTEEIDSLIVFFEQEDEQEVLSWAYYLAGRIYHDAQNTPQALQFYQQSLDILLPQQDMHLHSLIHSQLSSLFLSQQLYDEAQTHIQSALHYDMVQKDTTGMIFDLRDMGNIYRSKETDDSCIYYFNQALQLAKLTRDHELATDIQTQIAAFHLQRGHAELCHRHILPALNTPDTASISGIYSIAAEMYKQLGRMDSAIYYYRKLEESGNLFSQQEAFKALANYHLKNSNSKAALYYTQLYEDITDSIQDITATETVSRIHAMYNYQKQVSENTQLRLSNAHKRNVIICISAIAICLVLLLYALWQKLRYNKTELDLQMKKLQELQKQQTSSAPTTKENEKKLYATHIYSRIQQLIDQGAIMNDTDWLQLENAIHQIYEQFMPRLTSVCKLSTQERHVCLLIKAGITPVNIATLTAHSKQAINNTRSRLFERTFRRKGSPSEWDQFIQEL
ncbi:MAG: hypothetical protein IJL54_04525 [Prevotella sp.]|nr:hypothetical protein [Prevotella sp.]